MGRRLQGTTTGDHFPEGEMTWSFQKLRIISARGLGPHRTGVVKTGQALWGDRGCWIFIISVSSLRISRGEGGLDGGLG